MKFNCFYTWGLTRGFPPCDVLGDADDVGLIWPLSLGDMGAPRPLPAPIKFPDLTDEEEGEEPVEETSGFSAWNKKVTV